MHRLSQRQLGTTLLSYSRQRLSRPARFYSAPSKAVRAQPALASTPPPEMDFMPFNVPGDHKTQSLDAMDRFLKGPTPFTIVDTPLPVENTSVANSLLFPSSPAQESLAVVEACLHNYADVPRAKYVFDQLREQGGVEIGIQVYNLVLSAYLHVATTTKSTSEREVWLRRAWNLFEEISNGTAGVTPTAPTYSVMCAAWHR
jgi:DNA-directed RNA polymerase, mitochondrial